MPECHVVLRVKQLRKQGGERKKEGRKHRSLGSNTSRANLLLPLLTVHRMSFVCLFCKCMCVYVCVFVRLYRLHLLVSFHIIRSHNSSNLII